MKKCPFGCVDYEIMPSSFAIKKFLEQLKFTCLNKNNGCNEIIDYNNLEQHDKNCNYINAVCPNNQCRIKIPWNLLNNHIQNECLYTLFECSKCHLKLNRKEYLSHSKICGIFNKELDKQSPIINKLTDEEIKKNNEIFNNVMNSIENIPFFNTNENKEKNDNNNNNININMNDLNVLFKTLIFTLSGKFSAIENQMIKINTTLQQFSENNLVFYQSINDELENINEKLSSLNVNESVATDNNNRISIKSSEKNFNTYNNINNNILSSSISQQNNNNNNNKEDKKNIFPISSRNINTNINDKLILSTKKKEREKSIKRFDKFKATNKKDLLSTSKNKTKKINKYDLSDNNLNIDEIKDKNKNSSNKNSITINTLKTKEKFIKGMKSTKYIEKLKGIQPKKQSFIISNNNIEDKSSIDNIINEQSNNYLISNNYNTINTTSYIHNNKIKNNNYLNNSSKKENLRDKLLKNESNDIIFDHIFSNQEIILDKIQNLEKVMSKTGNNTKDNNSNNEFLSSFNSHKQNSVGTNNNNSINIPSESPRSTINKNQS
jgi:hypothetical protein